MHPRATTKNAPRCCTHLLAGQPDTIRDWRQVRRALFVDAGRFFVRREWPPIPSEACLSALMLSETGFSALMLPETGDASLSLPVRRRRTRFGAARQPGRDDARRF